MADRKSFVNVDGIVTGIPDADNLKTGSGLVNASGNLAITPAGTEVQIGSGKNLVAVGGTSAFDFSPGSGLFKTSTGANTLSGDVTVAAGKDITAAAGDGAFDFSAGTGLFKTSTGANTLSGDVTLAAGKNISVAAGASAVDFSGGTGLFKTTTGAVTIGPGAVTVSGATTFSAAGTALTVTNNALISGNLTVSGNITMNGTAFTTESETVLIADNHLYLNDGYTADAAQTGGLVVNYDPTTTTDTVAAGGFTAGVATVSNPTVATTAAAAFAAHDIIQVSGSTSNDGLYEVLSSAANVLTIKGIGTTATTQDFFQNQFTASAGAVGSIFKVAVSVIRAGTDGLWESAIGSSSTGFAFTDFATITTATLQGAYNNDTDGSDVTITTNSTDGDVIIAGTQKLKITATNGLSMGADNTSIKVGAGDDLTINHDGTNTIVTSATGNLLIDNTAVTGATIVRLGTDTSATKFEVQGDDTQPRLTVSGATSSITLHTDVKGGLALMPLSTPAAPTVSPQGATGATTWGYKISALSNTGETVASTETTIANGNATLTGSNFNRVTWTSVEGATQYKVYRTTAGGTPATTGAIGTVNANSTLQLDDTGLAASGAVPTLNTTNRLGIGTSTPGAYLDVAGGTFYDAGTGIMYVSGTFPTVATEGNCGVEFNFNSAGSSAFAQDVICSILNAGFTGASLTSALNGANAAAGTSGNHGVLGHAQGSALSIGIGGYASAGSTRIAGLFSLDSGPSGSGGASAALVANNAAQASPIFLALDAGTEKFRIDDGGHLRLKDDVNLRIGTGDDLTINHNGTDTTATSATGNLIVDNTAATGATILRLGTDTSATKVEIRNDSDAAILSINGAKAITIAAGATLATTSTGNINLPQNASARFQIEGVATTAGVTAANLNTLTDGSDASALHVHAASAATYVQVSGTSGEALNAGEIVSWADAAGSPRVFQADADGTGQRKNAVGISRTTVGAAGSAVTIQVAGETAALADTVWEGGTFPAAADAGKRVYMALTAGKLTLTAPTASGQRTLRVGHVSVGGTGASKIIIAIGEGMDN